MFPCLSIEHATCCRDIDVELPSYSRRGWPLLPREDVAHVGVGELGRPYALSAGVKSPLYRVRNVLPLRANNQVRWINAHLVVAGMAHYHPRRDRAASNLIGHAMRLAVDTLELKHAVPSGIHDPRPLLALVASWMELGRPLKEATL